MDARSDSSLPTWERIPVPRQGGAYVRYATVPWLIDAPPPEARLSLSRESAHETACRAVKSYQATTVLPVHPYYYYYL
jgi:hypothetical protein